MAIVLLKKEVNGRTSVPVLCVQPLVLKPSLSGLSSRSRGRIWCTLKNLQFPYKHGLKLTKYISSGIFTFAS